MSHSETFRTPLDPQVVRVVEAVARIAPERYEEVGAAQAREAFNRLASLRKQLYDDEPVKSVDDRTFVGPACELKLRVYHPDLPHNDRPLPVVLFLHGGGWTVGDVESYDSQARRVCNAIGAIIVSADYRLAPEHPYPAAFEDAVAALQWTAAHASELGGDATRLGVMGDSAGANLAAAASLWARDHDGPSVKAQCLVYPSLDVSKAYPSLDTYADGPFLTKPTTQWFRANYLPDMSRSAEPYASPLCAETHAGLPATVIAIASNDPLRDQGEAYATALEQAGVTVWSQCYQGQAHGFVAQTLLVDEAARAVEEFCAAFRALLDA